jgi:hypothetical protein
MNNKTKHKKCIFCGDHVPNNVKTKEHVLAQWLISLTGNPKRVWTFGENLEKNKVMEFSLDNLTFPACDGCNGVYSKLENTAKPLIERLIRREDLLAKDYKVLLDWLDKIRVGYWAGMQMLLGNEFGIIPKFKIANRIGKCDRMLVVYPFEKLSKGLNIIGCDTPIFKVMPSAFGMRINDIILLNVSYDYMLAELLGYPFPIEFTQEKMGFNVTKMKSHYHPTAPGHPFVFLKPSVIVGQVKTAPGFRNLFYKEYSMSEQSFVSYAYLVNKDYGTGIVDFCDGRLKFVHDDERITFGMIHKHESHQAQTLINQIYKLQEWGYENSILKGDINKDVIKFQRLHVKKLLRNLPPSKLYPVSEKPKSAMEFPPEFFLKRK